MSQTTRHDGEDWLFICDYCGTPAYSKNDECPALDDGRCRP